MYKPVVNDPPTGCLLMGDPAAGRNLHDEAPGGGVGPVVGVLQAQQDVLACCSILVRTICLHLLRARLQLPLLRRPGAALISPATVMKHQSP